VITAPSIIVTPLSDTSHVNRTMGPLLADRRVEIGAHLGIVGDSVDVVVLERLGQVERIGCVGRNGQPVEVVVGVGRVGQGLYQQ
jgi:hypothetical protein